MHQIVQLLSLLIYGWLQEQWTEPKQTIHNIAGRIYAKSTTFEKVFLFDCKHDWQNKSSMRARQMWLSQTLDTVFSRLFKTWPQGPGVYLKPAFNRGPAFINEVKFSSFLGWCIIAHCLRSVRCLSRRPSSPYYCSLCDFHPESTTFDKAKTTNKQTLEGSSQF